MPDDVPIFYSCKPRWCGGVADDPCTTARETGGRLHDDELDAFDDEEYER